MPRLRYKKSYDFSLYETRDEDEDEEDQKNEPITGQSWLSNAVIASQLSESRIKTAIQNLKAQIAVLENELLSRRLTRSHETRTDWSKIGYVRRNKDGTRYDEQPTRVRNKKTSRSGSGLQKIRKTLIKLGVKDVDALLKEWERLNSVERTKT